MCSMPGGQEYGKWSVSIFACTGGATISCFWDLLKYLEKKQFLVQGRNGAETVQEKNKTLFVAVLSKKSLLFKDSDCKHMTEKTAFRKQLCAQNIIA